MDDKEEQSRLLRELNDKLGRYADKMQQLHIAEYVQLMSKPAKNHFAEPDRWISRGVGIAIGLTFVTSTILYVLRALGALDLPIFGNYIADIVKHVRRSSICTNTEAVTDGEGIDCSTISSPLL